MGAFKCYTPGIKTWHLTKRDTAPPQTMTKRGTLLFADADVHVLRQIENLQRLASFLDTSQPSRFLFFFLVSDSG